LKRTPSHVRKRLLFFMGLPLLLGSWASLASSQLFILGIAWPAVREERVLRAELTGYGDYTTSVCYRFIPFVW
jgi:protein-S-isoprenylcysteine O-methyltransferase Ste14